MILLLVGTYTGLLWVLVKIGVFPRWYGWMKVSPVVVGVTAFMVIFLPLNWNAPMGGATVTVGSIGIKPGVSGPVVKIHATSQTPISKGDILFEIDDTLYAAAVQQAQAQLSLAQDQLARKEDLLTRKAVAEAEVEALRANVAVAQASLTTTKLDLDNTKVRAPFDGMIPAMTLLPGNRVAPLSAVLAFLDIDNPVFNLVLSQNQVRHVKVGQKAEAVFRAVPGQTFQGTVAGLYLTSPTAEYQLDGATPEVPSITDTKYVVVLDLDAKGAYPAARCVRQGIGADRSGHKVPIYQPIDPAHDNLDELFLMFRLAITTLLASTIATAAVSQDVGPLQRLEAASEASIGGPASAQAQQEQDRLRRLQTSRWPELDRAIDPVESWKEQLKADSGLSLSFDYQALYQKSNSTTTGVDDGAAGQIRVLGNWTLLDRDGSNPGSFVFILENRHKLGLDQTPGGLAGEIGYAGQTGLTFGDTGSSLSVAYWSQTILNGRGGIVVGRIDPGDYTDILGYVNPRTGFQNYVVNYNPVLTIPDPGFGIGGGAYVTDQVYVLGMASDANGSLTELDWFPGGSEFYKYAEIGWTPAQNQRYLTNIHVGAYHIDSRAAKGLDESYGVVLSANHTFKNDLMVFGRLGWSNGTDPIAKRGATAGLIWRPGFYDDLIGVAATWADPVAAGLNDQTTVEAFYRIDLADNVAITASFQHLNNPGFNTSDPWLFGLRLRFNL